MSVYKRRGSWFCDITIDGRRVQRVLKKARTRAQAIKAESVIQKKLFENKYKVEKRPDLLRITQADVPRRRDCLHMLFETFGSFRLREITPLMIEKFKQKRLEGKTFYKRKRNPATVNRDLCVLSKIFSLAFDAELIDSNPGRRVRKFRTDTRRTRYLTFDEEARLFEKLEGQERVQRIVAMAINTGMRQGEIFNLT
jgi:integrase